MSFRFDFKKHDSLFNHLERTEVDLGLDAANTRPQIHGLPRFQSAGNSSGLESSGWPYTRGGQATKASTAETKATTLAKDFGMTAPL
jgi:hypothetical protein